jgi:hypothetical protein
MPPGMAQDEEQGHARRRVCLLLNSEPQVTVHRRHELALKYDSFSQSNIWLNFVARGLNLFARLG